MEVLLNAFPRGPALCILRSEMCALATVSNVWNSEGNQDCPGRALYMQRYVTLIYDSVSVRQEIPGFLYT